MERCKQFISDYRYPLVGGALATSFALWYCSDLSNARHHPSTIREPPEQVKASYFKNKRNMWIFTKCWLPDGPPSAVVFLVHGHGEHISNKGYENIGQCLTAAGLAVFGLDHAGHGRSNGSRGHVPHIRDLSDDLAQYIAAVSARYPELPKFGLGHSMGGLVLLYCVAENGLLDGIVVTSAASCSHRDPLYSDTVRLVGAGLAGVLPKLKAIKLDTTGLTRNQAALQEYLADPLNNGGYLNLATGNAIVEAGRVLWEKLPRLIVPILIIHGTEDTVVHPQLSKDLYARVGSRDKELLEPPQVKHEIFQDPERETLFQYILQWYKDRM